MKTTSKYGEELEKRGFKYPRHEKPGLLYTNVHGEKQIVDPQKMFMAVRYTPKKEEIYFEDMDRAMKYAENLKGDWQVLQRITGEIILEP